MPSPAAASPPLTSLWFDAALVDAGWQRGVRLQVQGGRIAGIETGTAPRAGDARHGIALPGLHNVHSHAFQRAMAGMAETRSPAHDSFWSWRERMYALVNEITPEQFEAIAAQAYVEMLEAGFTRVGEFHYLHHDARGRPYADPGTMSARVAAAAQATGIGLTLLPVLYCYSGFDAAPPTAGQRRFVSTPDAFAELLAAARTAAAALPDATVGIAPHSLRAVGPPQLRAALALAPQGPVHIHAAEQTAEVADCLAATGRRPVEWLLEHVGLDARWCVVHATHMSDTEVAALAGSGAVAGLCPISEANLGDGFFRAREYLAAGGRFAIGTDSNVLISGAEELRLLEYGQRLTHRARNVLGLGETDSTARALLDAAWRGGARALGAPSAVLSVGAPADIVALDADHPALLECRGDAWLDGWVFAAGRSAIDAVWRHGELVVSGGRHLARDAIQQRFRAVLAELRA